MLPVDEVLRLTLTKISFLGGIHEQHTATPLGSLGLVEDADGDGDASAFKSMLRRRGIRVISITEQAGDSPTGKLLEAIIESVDEFYSEKLTLS